MWESRSGMQALDPDGTAVRSPLMPAKLHRAGLTALLSMAWLAACSDPAGEQTPANETEGLSTRAGDPVTSLEDIEGFWLVLSFDGFEPDWRSGVPWREAYVQVGEEGLSYSIGCNHSGNPASLGEDAILRDTGDGSRLQTLMGCPPDWEDRDGRFFGFFGTNPKVTRAGEDLIVLTSKAGELVLVEPEAWRMGHAPELSEVTGRWVPRMASTYNGWGHAGFGIGEDAGVITITEKAITWSECPGTVIDVEWTGDARLRRVGAVPKPCEAVARASVKGPREVVEMLGSSPAVIRTGPVQITLIDGTGETGRRLDLQSEESVLNPPELPPAPPDRSRPPPPPSPPPIKE